MLNQHIFSRLGPKIKKILSCTTWLSMNLYWMSIEEINLNMCLGAQKSHLTETVLLSTLLKRTVSLRPFF